MRCRIAALIGSIAALQGACTDGGTAGTPVSSRARPAAVAPALDLAALAQRTRHAFRASPSGGYESSGSAFRARLGTEGAFHVSAVAGRTTPALILGPAVVGRDAGPAGAVRVEGDGSLAIPRGGAIERLRSSAAGIEQSWEIATRPPGRGDLRVRVRARGLAYKGATGGGLHFSGGDLGLRYGHATWVDAAGRRTRGEARFGGGEIVLAIPERLLDATTWPAVLDPVISPETAIDAPILGGAAGAQSEPSTAFDGTRYLVAWSDGREVGQTDIFAARVALDGTVQDPVGLPIATGPGQRGSPTVAAGAGVFLVSWAETVGDGTSRVVAARVSGDGVVLDDPPVLVGTTFTSQARVTAAFDGTEFRLAWVAFTGAVDSTCLLSTRRLAATGAPAAAAAALGSFTCNADGRAAIACDGSTCLVATAGVAGVISRLVDPNGLVAGSVSAASFRTAHATVSFDGARYLLAWQDDPNSTGRASIAGRFIDRTGLPSGNVFAIAAGGDRLAPAAVFDGTRHVVAWEDRTASGGDLVAVHVGVDGTVAETSPVPISAAPGEQRAPSLAASSQGVLVAFEDTRSDGVGDVFAARLDSGVTVLDADGILVSASGNREIHSAAAFDGSQWLVTWEDSRNSGTHDGDIFGARISAEGAVLDPVGFLISGGPANEARPAVAGCGSGWVVAWEDERNGGGADVFAARVAPGGTVRDPDGIPVAGGLRAQDRPAVACAAGVALIAWQGGGAFSVPARLGAARLSFADGVLLDPDGITVALGPDGPPSVAAATAGFEVVWPLLDASGTGSVQAARVSADGVAGPAKAVCAGAGPRSSPVVSGDGTGFQVVFEQPEASGTGLRVAHLTADGTMVDFCGAALRDATSALDPQMAFDGVRYLAVWRDVASGDLRATQLTPGGGELGSFVVSAGPGPQRAGAIACDGAGGCLIPIERGDPALGVSRAAFVRVVSGAPASACIGDGECPAGTDGVGHCVDGVCCDTACGGGNPNDCQACSIRGGAAQDGVCAPVVVGQVCEGAAGNCSRASRCDGEAVVCPPQGSASDGTICDDGDACTRQDVCRNGACTGTNPIVCTAVPCATNACNPATGSCEFAPLDAGTPCDDLNPCTENDVCGPIGSLSCRGIAKICPAQDQCHAGVCDAVTGACGEVTIPDGNPCNDGNACTISDACVAGKCVGANPVVCPPPDSCHEPALCDRGTGQCVYAARPDGSVCDDGDPCTQADACAAGSCVGRPVVCLAIDACHDPGTCDPGTGTCSTPPKPDGTTCDDANACTQGDRCVAGVCQSGNVSCAPPDACHEFRSCDPATGRCSFAPKADGSPCDDGDACTAADTCVSGACRPGTPKVCPDPGVCRAPACDPATGGCSFTLLPDGSECPGGKCAAGQCRPEVKSAAAGGCATGSSDAAALPLVLALLVAARRRKTAVNTPPPT